MTKAKVVIKAVKVDHFASKPGSAIEKYILERISPNTLPCEVEIIKGTVAGRDEELVKFSDGKTMPAKYFK